MRDDGLKRAIEALGGVGRLARQLGIAQPSVSNWSRVPAERVLTVESIAGISRAILRPDLYPSDSTSGLSGSSSGVASPRGAPDDNPADALDPVDPFDRARGEEYLLLATLLRAAPHSELLGRLAKLGGDDTALGRAHAALARAAANADPDDVETEFFDLFIGLGRGEVLPYASYYLTGFLNERPLAKVRSDLNRIGAARAVGHPDPEDHIASLYEVMAGLLLGLFEGGSEAADRFRERHLASWSARLIEDLAKAPSARFYRAVAAVARVFDDIEQESAGLYDG
jgi:TorA maturation chaperone TorD/DNA-binding transcriptional regulator YdaS (Cro superfamily)